MFVKLVAYFWKSKHHKVHMKVCNKIFKPQQQPNPLIWKRYLPLLYQTIMAHQIHPHNNNNWRHHLFVDWSKSIILILMRLKVPGLREGYWRLMLWLQSKVRESQSECHRFSLVRKLLPRHNNNKRLPSHHHHQQQPKSHRQYQPNNQQQPKRWLSSKRACKNQWPSPTQFHTYTTMNSMIWQNVRNWERH